MQNIDEHNKTRYAEIDGIGTERRLGDPTAAAITFKLQTRG